MSNKYLIVKDGLVVNVVLSDSALEEDWFIDQWGASIGWKFDGEKAIEPDPEPVDPQLMYRDEYSWASSELSKSDVMIQYVLDNDDRAVSTEENWREYRRLLRDYASVSDGIYSINGERPVSPE